MVKRQEMEMYMDNEPKFKLIRCPISFITVKVEWEE